MPGRYEFSRYVFDDRRGLEGPLGRIPLRSRDAQLLRVLLEANGRVVSKQVIAQAVWPARDVSDASIEQAVHRLRRAMPAPAGVRIVQTLYGQGLRIGVAVAMTPEAAPRDGHRTRGSAIEALLVSARESSALRTVSGIATAIEAVGRALELDPRFVEAWCALADFRLMQAIRGTAPQRTAAAAAAAAAAEALSIDPARAPALAVRGFVRALIEGNVSQGLADLDRSFAIDADCWTARGLRGWALLAAGRVREAVVEAQAAAELNPWSTWYSGLPAHYLFLAGEREAALERGRQAVRQFPQSDYAPFALSQVASALGRHEEAIGAGRRAKALAPDTPLLHTSLASALAMAGRADEARAEIGMIEASAAPLPAVWLAPAWLALGCRERALEMLRIAREQCAPQYVYTLYDPRFAALRRVP